MTMRDWIEKLDDFLRLSGRDILTHAGKISHNSALQKAHNEYQIFKKAWLSQSTRVEEHFIEAEKN